MPGGSAGAAEHEIDVRMNGRAGDNGPESVFPTGLPIGTCQQALDTACGLYLNDPTAWT
jgi:hypothetical protein